MASLVAYEGSDSESESEGEGSGLENDGANSVTKRPLPHQPESVVLAGGAISDSEDEEEEEEEASSVSLFAALPTPSPADVPPSVLEEDELEDFVKKKPSTQDLPPPMPPKPKRAKILLPSLSELKGEGDNDEEGLGEGTRTPLRMPGTGKKPCALLTMLPPPKTGSGKAQAPPTTQVTTGRQPLTTTSMVPDSVLRRKQAAVPVKPKVKKPVRVSSLAESSDSEEEEGGKDFFSLDKPEEEVEPIFEPLPKIPETTKVNESADIPFDLEFEIPSEAELAEDELAGEGPSELQLDEVALAALQGRGRIAGKKHLDVLNLRDVSADSVLPGPESRLKSLTEEKDTRSSSASLPGGMARRKHQITFLAAQAKARDLELRNAWAENRISRKAAQSKYGF